MGIGVVVTAVGVRAKVRAKVRLLGGGAYVEVEKAGVVSVVEGLVVAERVEVGLAVEETVVRGLASVGLGL